MVRHVSRCRIISRIYPWRCGKGLTEGAHGSEPDTRVAHDRSDDSLGRILAGERGRPSLRAQRRDWQQTWTDLAYWFFTPLVTRAATRIALGIVFALIAVSQGLTLDELRRVATTRQTWASTLPVWIQIPLVMLLADLMAYWTHRLFHGRTLWRFHAIHHSSRTVDWLSSVRLHPVNDVVSRIVQVLPLYWMGFSAGVLAGFVPFLTLYALLLHANVSWTYGRLR